MNYEYIMRFPATTLKIMQVNKLNFCILTL